MDRFILSPCESDVRPPPQKKKNSEKVNLSRSGVQGCHLVVACGDCRESTISSHAHNRDSHGRRWTVNPRPMLDKQRCCCHLVCRGRVLALVPVKSHNDFSRPLVEKGVV